MCIYWCIFKFLQSVKSLIALRIRFFIISFLFAFQIKSDFDVLLLQVSLTFSPPSHHIYCLIYICGLGFSVYTSLSLHWYSIPVLSPIKGDTMALNLSHDPIFATRLPEESLFSAIKFGNGYVMEGYPEKNLVGFGDYWNFNLELESSHDYRKESSEKVSDDIADLLPTDPFGMGVTATFTAITGRIEDIEKDFGLRTLGFGTDEIEVKGGDDQLFAGLNLVGNGAMRFHPEAHDMNIDEKSVGRGKDEEFCDGLHDGSFSLDGNIEEFMGFSYEKYWVSSMSANECQGCTEVFCDGDPPDALYFALGYLGVRDLLSVERVCKSLRDAVQNDPLLWRNIHIDQPLSDRITDDALLQLTSRAQGSLRCLSLVDCLKINDGGLKSVLEGNPGLTKLSVPGCVRLSVEGIVCNLKVFNSACTPGIKHLRIGGIFGLTNKHFEELKILLGADIPGQCSAHRPRFYHGGQLYLSFDDDRAIDIETCPKCHQLRRVYDCPAESRQGKHHTTQLCRACIFCIPRCISCGCCIMGCDYEETFCLDLLCLDCRKQLLECQERQEVVGVSS